MEWATLNHIQQSYKKPNRGKDPIIKCRHHGASFKKNPSHDPLSFEKAMHLLEKNPNPNSMKEQIESVIWKKPNLKSEPIDELRLH